MSIKHNKSYIDLLRDEFAARKSHNRLYSLRGFAAQLGLSPTYLSLVFSGKRHLSLRMAVQIARKLGWERDQRNYFLTLLEYANPKNEESQRIAAANLKKLISLDLQFESLDVATFSAISFWYYSAILAAVQLKNVKTTTSFIAKKIKLDPFETGQALRKLERLGLVTEMDQVWVPSKNNLQVKSIPSEAIRNHHKQFLSIADRALDEQAFEERDFSNITLTVDPKKLPMAKKRIAEFYAEMTNLLEGSEATEIYQLSAQLFKLS